MRDPDERAAMEIVVVAMWAIFLAAMGWWIYSLVASAI